MTNLKTYDRTIDLRSYIESQPDLAGLPYDVKKVDVDGKRKSTAVFTITTAAGQKAVKDHGFEWTVPAADQAQPEPEAKTMAQKAMLANLTIKGWSGRTTDKELSSAVAQSYQATDGWIKMSKNLVNKEALKAVRKAEAAARKTHKELTLIWGETGERLLPSKAFYEYQERMGKHQDEHTAAVDAFMAEYETLKSEARNNLGGTFNEADYPAEAELFGKFLFDTELTALDVTGDFRVAMGDEEMKRLQAQIQKRTEQRLATALTDVYSRVHDVVAELAEKLNGYKPAENEGDKVEGIFRDSALRNVKDVVDLIPLLNVIDDPDLAALGKQITDTLLVADAKTLREDHNAREHIADEAAKIADAMAAFM